MLSKLVKKYVSLLKNIPERHYWPIFVFLSLYFIVPVSEITVTVAAILYFKFEKRIAPVIQKLTKRIPDFFKYGGSILFFLVMIDDTLFYGILIALAFWSAKQVKKESGTSSSQDEDAVLELQGNQETHETDSYS